jgi:hypothetical protein
LLSTSTTVAMSYSSNSTFDGHHPVATKISASRRR